MGSGSGRGLGGKNWFFNGVIKAWEKAESGKERGESLRQQES